MISNILVNVLDSNLTELTKGTNLFAEGGILGECVIVKTDSFPVGQIVPDVRRSHAKFYIKGYEIADAIELGEKMVKVLTGLKGVFTHDTVKYNIKAVDILSTPSVVSIQDKVVLFNANVFYVRTSN